MGMPLSAQPCVEASSGKDFYRRFACFWAAGRALGVRYRKHALWAGSNVLCCHEGTAVYKFLFLFLKIGRVMKIKNDLLTSPYDTSLS